MLAEVEEPETALKFSGEALGAGQRKSMKQIQ